MNLSEIGIGGVIVAAVLGITYLAVIGVALFHPDKEHRADALRALQSHRLTRKKKQAR
jgi:hypothetical protein